MQITNPNTKSRTQAMQWVKKDWKKRIWWNSSLSVEVFATFQVYRQIREVASSGVLIWWIQLYQIAIAPIQLEAGDLHNACKNWTDRAQSVGISSIVISTLLMLKAGGSWNELQKQKIGVWENQLWSKKCTKLFFIKIQSRDR